MSDPRIYSGSLVRAKIVGDPYYGKQGTVRKVEKGLFYVFFGDQTLNIQTGQIVEYLVEFGQYELEKIERPRQFPELDV